MQAIQTKYLAPTNVRGARIKATCERGSVVISYPSDLTTEAGHCYAANHLCERFVAEDSKKYGSDPFSNPWGRKRVSGGLKGGTYVHVFTT